jgi:hypothetical protein
MQSGKDWFVRHGRRVEIGVLLCLLFILIRTIISFLLGIHSNMQAEPPVPIGIMLAIGITVGFVAGILLSVATSALYLLPLLTRRLILRVGSEEIRVDLGSVDKTMRLLEQKISTMQELPQVFLSYSYHDREFARRLVEDLESQAIEIWLLEQQTDASSLIEKKVRHGIEESRWFLVIISPSALESDWVGKELALALQVEKARGHPFIIPVLYKGDEVPPKLNGREYIDFRTDYQVSMRKLAERLIVSMKDTELEEVSLLLDDVLLALDRGDISLSKAEELQQVCSLAKWLRGDTTGWYELWEEVRFGDGLRPAVRSALEAELGRIQQGIPRPEMPPGYEERLRSLLSP